jgi:hypothetical protein
MTLDANDVLRQQGPAAVRRLHDSAKGFQPKCQPTVNGAPIAQRWARQNCGVLYNADAIECTSSGAAMEALPSRRSADACSTMSPISTLG